MDSRGVTLNSGSGALSEARTIALSSDILPRIVNETVSPAYLTMLLLNEDEVVTVTGIDTPEDLSADPVAV